MDRGREKQMETSFILYGIVANMAGKQFLRV